MNELLVIHRPPYDPNLFLSTTAQATAALVAIIGGFLVSRLIALVSEKSQQSQSLEELRSKRRVKDAELEKFRNTVNSGIQKWFREDNLDNILEARGNSNYTKMVDDFDTTGNDRQVIAEYANNLKNIVTRAFKELGEVYKSPSIIPDSSAKMRADGIRIDPGHDEEIFERVASFSSASLDSGRQPAEAEPAKNFGPQKITSPEQIESMPTAPTMVSSRHDAAIRERDRLNEELGVIVGEIKLLESRLPAMGQQRWLINGFLILAYFSVIGIVYPLYLMTRNPVVADATARETVLLGFVSGLVALLAFIWSAVSDLKGFEKGATVPE